jgi:hypothetical protein
MLVWQLTADQYQGELESHAKPNLHGHQFECNQMMKQLMLRKGKF